MFFYKFNFVSFLSETHFYWRMAHHKYDLALLFVVNEVTIGIMIQRPFRFTQNQNCKLLRNKKEWRPWQTNNIGKSFLPWDFYSLIPWFALSLLGKKVDKDEELVSIC